MLLARYDSSGCLPDLPELLDDPSLVEGGGHVPVVGLEAAHVVGPGGSDLGEQEGQLPLELRAHGQRRHRTATTLDRRRALATRGRLQDEADETASQDGREQEGMDEEDMDDGRTERAVGKGAY